jgi:aspartate/methionine/tyrosine aminotransferase
LHAVAQRAQRWLQAAPSDEAGTAETTTAASSPVVRATVIAAMQRNACDHYTRRPGIAPLCRAVTERLAAKDVVTGGVAETRFVALRTLAAQQTLYLLPESLARYQVLAEFSGAIVQVIDLAGELPVAAGGVLLIAAAQPESVLARLAPWAAMANLTVIVDAIDVDLFGENSPEHPFASLPGMAERTLTLGSFANLTGLDAWQVAWFAGAKPLVVKVRNLKQAMTICSPAPGQYAALAGLQGDAA